jgi:hypothetical protein
VNRPAKDAPRLGGFPPHELEFTNRSLVWVPWGKIMIKSKIKIMTRGLLSIVPDGTANGLTSR